jgi:hypothetical protein
VNSTCQSAMVPSALHVHSMSIGMHLPLGGVQIVHGSDLVVCTALFGSTIAISRT